MKLSRRQFLKVSAFGIGTGVVGSGLLFAPAVAASELSLFPTPTDLGERSGNKVVFKLEASAKTVEVGGRKAQLLTYNGSFPGPTLRMREGDDVRIELTNGLAQETNLHLHGLRIPMDQTNSETPFRRVAAGETILYEFSIPERSAGTHWYHPHTHGSVAPQLFSGLTGAIIVEGPADAVFDDLPEQLLVLKDFEVQADGSVPEHSRMDWMMGREGSLLTVNGAVLPQLAVADGRVRLRIVNASNARFYRLSLPNASLNVIATDGSYVARPYPVTELLMAPGERYDVVAQFAEVGTFELTALPYDRAPEDMTEEKDIGAAENSSPSSMGGMNMGASSKDSSQGNSSMSMNMGGSKGGTSMGGMNMGGMNMGMGMMSTGVAAPTPLMTFRVAAPSTYRLPDDLLPIRALSPQDASERRRIVLSENMAGLEFYIDGRLFDVDRVDFAPKLGTVEHWEIVNETGMDHPMHLHVFPFQIYARNGVREERLAFKDVVNVAAGETVDILIPFVDFAGRTVFHCHVVEHEDLGMMSIVEVGA